MNKNQTKLIAPIFILIGILSFFGFEIIKQNYEDMNSLKKLKEKIILNNDISDLLHSLQKERGLSSGYLIDNNNKVFKSELLKQRKKTDKCIIKLKNNLKKYNFKKEELGIDLAINKLQELDKLRKDIDDKKIDFTHLIKKYSDTNSLLLDVIVKTAKYSHIPQITQNILSYINLLYYKEYLGIQRAEGVYILSRKEIDEKMIIKFTNIISMQKQAKLMFIKFASKDILDYYNHIAKDLKVFSEVNKIQNLIISKNFKNIKSKYWFDTITIKLNKLDRVSKYVKIDTKKKINHAMETSKQFFIVTILITFISIIVFIYMLLNLMKLLKNEQKLRFIMDKYIISSITDLKGKILDVSEAFCEISGFKKEELIGKPHNIVRHPDMPKEAFKELWKTIQSGKSWKGKVKNRKKSGDYYWVYANIEPLYNSKGQIDSYISIRLDITEQEKLIQKIKEEEEKNKQNEKLLQQQHRLAQMGEMISMIAHQWRQPLSAITAASGAITLKAKLNKLDKDTALELSNKISDFSKHLSSTIDDFRNFFKSNKELKETNFEKILENVMTIVENSLKNNKIDVSIKINSIKNFNTYENEVKQVILNLIKNAEDALLENNIENPNIEIYIDGEKLVISDNAGGIPQDIMDKIFDPYFSTKEKKDGTGLGLYMSKTIIEEHCKGTLHVKNNKNGAEFMINLGER